MKRNKIWITFHACLIVLAAISLPLKSQLLTGTEDEILIWNGPGPGSDTLTITQTVYDRTIGGECKANRAVERITESGIIPFIPENPNGTAILLCPGGAYSRVVLDKEGTDIAEWYNTLGISAFVVKYRLPTNAHINKHYVTLQDAQRAIRYVRGHAEHWGIDPDKIGIMGASAGGHMASCLATQYDLEVYSAIDSLDEISAKPNFMVLIYPVVSMEAGVTHDGTRANLLGSSPSTELIEELSPERHVTSESPITFMARANDDTAVPAANCERLRDSLTAAGVSNELHIYNNGGHGLGKCEAVGTDFYNWIYDCGSWLYENGLTDPGLSMPTAPEGLTATETLHDRVTVEWTVTDTNAVGFTIFLNGVRKKTVNKNSATITKLKAETSYTVGVSSFNLIGKSDTVSIEITTPEEEVGVEERNINKISLAPNPVASLDQIIFSLPEANSVSISVFNISGKKVEEKQILNISRGKYCFDFSSENVNSGIYFVDLKIDASRYSRIVQVTGEE